MAVMPRVIFTRFSSADRPEFRPWIDHLERVLGSAAPAVPRHLADATVWQLVSANNRELARSASVFSGFREAYESAAGTISRAPSGVVRAVVDERSGLQGWYLAVDERPEMVCARWYFADRERTQAARVALAAMGDAVVVERAKLQPDRFAGEAMTRVL